jgi:signal transduction histidine kinase
MLEAGWGNCSLSVSDNGVGFPPDRLSRLNHPQNAAELQNHGLGLTIVRQIVKAHGGTAEFRNLPAGGCLVVLCLPVCTAVITAQ